MPGIAVEALDRQCRDAIDLRRPESRHIKPGFPVDGEGKCLQLDDPRIGAGLLELEHDIGNPACAETGRQSDATVPTGLRDRHQKLGYGSADTRCRTDDVKPDIRFLIEPGE